MRCCICMKKRQGDFEQKEKGFSFVEQSVEISTGKVVKRLFFVTKS